MRSFFPTPCVRYTDGHYTYTHKRQHLFPMWIYKEKRLTSEVEMAQGEVTSTSTRVSHIHRMCIYPQGGGAKRERLFAQQPYNRKKTMSNVIALHTHARPRDWVGSRDSPTINQSPLFLSFFFLFEEEEGTYVQHDPDINLLLCAAIGIDHAMNAVLRTPLTICYTLLPILANARVYRVTK